tara:strand:+ start:476 stop:745 length:270 start_codon:yes stop_codon:yes gene_type:complete
MAHKLVGFSHSSNSLNIEYIKNQLTAISNEIEGLVTEFANENDPRLALYNQKPGRLPCLMLFKNDTHKTHINAKLSNKKAIEWALTHIG